MGRLFPGRYQGEVAFCFQCGNTIYQSIREPGEGLEAAAHRRGRKAGGSGCADHYGEPRSRFCEWLDRVIARDADGVALFIDVWQAWARRHGESARQNRVGGLPRGHASVAFRKHLGVGLSERIQDNDNPHGRNNRGWRGLRLVDGDGAGSGSGDEGADA